MKRHVVLVLALAATAAPSVLGQELIRNGTFDQDLSNWGGSRPSPGYGVGEPTWIPGDDALGEMGFEGGAAILVTYAEDQPLYATAEVYADSAGGRYTTPVPVLGDPLNERRVVTPGISNTSTSRTNIGCANVGESGQAVYAEVHAADGSKLGTVNLLVRSKGWVQEPIAFPVSRGYVLWGNAEGMTGPPTGVSCFAVVVDNATNDGSLLR